MDPPELAEDDTLGLEENGGSSIMLVSKQGVRSTPARDYSAHDPCSDSGAPFAGAAPAAAKHLSSIGSSGSSSGDDVAQGGKDSTDPEKGKTTAPLLDKRGHRRKISNYSGEEDGGEGPPRHQRQHRHAVEGVRPSLCGRGGLLSPWRVRMLLLLQCLISVRTSGGAVACLVVV